VTDQPAIAPKPSRLMPLAAGGAALLALASAGLFYYATANKSAGTNGDAVKVVIGASACQPNALTVPAGRRTFEIHNASARPVEWEILDGIMVVEERENILPGFQQTMTANLKPGAYEITCGLLSNPRGTLTVTATAESDASAKAGPDLKAFIGPLSEYKVFLALQGSSLVTAVQALSDAIKVGNLEAARAAYEPARLPYRQVEAVVGRWSDLQNTIDPVADYLDKREADPAFTGFHRIEYGLFAENSTTGIAPVADRLVADVTELKARLRSVKLVPADLTDGVGRLARRLADGKIETGESSYAHADLQDFEASLAGIAKAAGLIRPLIPISAAALGAELDQKLAAARDALAALKVGDAYPAYDQIDAAGRKALAEAFRGVADTLDKVSAELALE
jgi:iron uptake system EfeUOB component EfeO/EfeM